MHQQNIHQKLKEAQALLTNINFKSREQRAPDHESELPRVSTKYERKNFYEKRTHHPDGPGGSYEGL